MRKDLFKRPLDQALLTDFFGSVQNIELTDTVETSTSPSLSEASLPDSEPLYPDEPAAMDNSSKEAERKPVQRSLEHNFEIGNPDQSQTWRYAAFVALSIGLAGALAAGSSIL